ncbi:hypothetical protein QYE76_052385 [Lolium multiflorum]|uniref:Uncharacterized protein n=1 Tax=Lolium multiflorum TaxID=4521 RepID=A0AAD8WJG1_LOLMU|nr:hypothetical protein QYE76_052385 [Lolium multiflorum]
MELKLCYCCPPSTPGLESPGADAGHYEELPVSVPPHVPQGLCRDDEPGLDGWEEGAYAEAAEQLPDHDHPDGAAIMEKGGGAGAAPTQWLRAAFASVCRMVMMSVTLCGHL